MKPKIIQNLTEYPALQKIIIDTHLVVVENEKKIYLSKNENNNFLPLKNVKTFHSLKDLNDHVDYNYTFFYGFYTHHFDYINRKNKSRNQK